MSMGATTAAPTTTAGPATTAAPATTVALATTPYKAGAALAEAEAMLTRSQSIGSTADLTEEGYAAVAGTCCTSDMEEFARRVVADLGLVVCNEGGLSGVVGYHTCEKGVQTLAKLIE